MKRNLILLLQALIWLAHPAWAAPLPDGIYPVLGIDQTLSTDDLKPLARMIGDSKIVALGESIHTSGGYLQAKFRLIKFLVEDLGFRALMMETPYGDALPATQYIASCSGGIDAAMSAIFGVFASTSTAGLFEWLCAYNQSHPQDPVSFYGFDIQEPWFDYPAIQGFLNRIVPTQASSLLQGTEQCVGATSKSESDFYSSAQSGSVFSQGQGVPEATHSSCLAGLSTVGTYLSDHESQIIQQTSLKDWTIAALEVDSLLSWEMMAYNFTLDVGASYEARDQGMAGMLINLRQLYFPLAKTIVFAHNFHISADGSKKVTQGFPTFHPVNMGTFLKKEFGADYFPVGLVGYDVGITWPGVQAPATPDPTALESLLHGLGSPYLLVDTSSPFLKPGSQYGLEGLLEVPSEQYGALFYLDSSPGMTYWNGQSGSRAAHLAPTQY